MFVHPSTNFKFRNANEFIDFVREPENNFYLFVGRTSPWEDDTNPPAINFSEKEKRDTWDDMMILRRIRPTDIIPGIRRVEWVSGTVYQEYNDEIGLEDTNFYVFTQERNIYLCVSNNGGSPSTVKPTHVSENVVEESDGYKWKYITTISTSAVNKFILNDYIPIESNQEIFESATPGAIEHLRIDSSGIGYRPNASVSVGNEIPVFIEGNGDQVATARASITTLQGSITSISLTDSGNGYFFSPGVEFPVAIRQIGSNGINQTAYGIATTDLNGQVDSVDVVIEGSNYQTGEVIVVQSSAEGYAETDGIGQIVNADMRIGRTGENFFKARAIPVAPSGSSTAILSPVISPEGGFGSNQFKQLYAHYALVSVEIDPTDVTNILSLNEFRRVGLIVNPLEYNDNPLSSDGAIAESDGYIYDSAGELIGTEYTGQTADARSRVILDTTTENFDDDETIVGESSGAVGLAITKFENDTLRFTIDDSLLSHDDIEFIVGEQIRGLNSGAIASVVDFIPPDVEKYSGEIYHINNIEPIVRSNDQKILVTFALKY